MSKLELNREVNEKLAKEFDKLFDIVKLMKADNVRAVDLRYFKMSGSNPYLQAIVDTVDNWEIVNNQILKVNRRDEIVRYIETKLIAIERNMKGIEATKVAIIVDREMVEKKIKELAVYDKQQEEKNVEALEQRERR